MVSPDGIVPTYLMDAGALPGVVRWLYDQPWPGYYKRAVLQGWAHVTGGSPTQADYATVDASGWQRPQTT